MDSVVNKILQRISKIYESYEERAAQMTEQKRQKSGMQIDKNERIFMEKLNRVQQNMGLLVKDMDKSESMKGSDMK